MEAYRADLRDLVAALTDHGVFRASEHEAWDEEIEQVEDVSELMITGEALHKAILDREGVDEVFSEHTEERIEAFV